MRRKTKERGPAHVKCRLDFPADGSREKLLCTIDNAHRYDLGGRRTLLVKMLSLGWLVGAAEAEAMRMAKTRELRAAPSEAPSVLAESSPGRCC